MKYKQETVDKMLGLIRDIIDTEGNKIKEYEENIKRSIEVINDYQNMLIEISNYEIEEEE